MLIAAPLHSGGRLRPDTAIEVERGIVRAVRPLGADTPDRRLALLLPRPSDLQVNGGGGVMLNAEPTPQGFVRVAEAHRGVGTGAIMPTLITDEPAVMEEAARTALALRGDPRFLGLHLEGPHIAPARRGTHAERFVRPLDEATCALAERLAAGGVRLKVTLAPERADPALLARLVASGALVAAGHSEATAQEARAAFAAGVRCVTHLFNAMEPMLARAPGLAGAAVDAGVPAGIIADGHHVDWTMIRLVHRASPRPGGLFAVSDAMATANGPDAFDLYGRRIELREGRLVNAEGRLAGAHLTMAEALRNLVRDVGLTPGEAAIMTTDAPRAALGLPPQALREGDAIGGWLALDGDWRAATLDA